MNKRKLAAVSVVFLSAIPIRQSLAAGDDASLEQAFKALQLELANLNVDTVTMRADGQTIPSNTTTELSRVESRPRTCSIRYHERIVANGKVVRDADSELYLGNLSVFDIVYEDHLGGPNASGFAIVPPKFHLRVWGSTPFNFHFLTAGAAERARSKFANVAKLCVNLGLKPPPSPKITPAQLGTGFPDSASFYPPAARAAHQEGSAVVRFCLDASGHLSQEPAILRTSGHLSLDAAAIELAKAGNGHYVPASRDGKNIPSCGVFSVRFQQ